MGQTINYLEKPESDVVIDYIEKRHKKGLYTLCLVFGLPGTGKSSTCLRDAQLVSMRLHNQDNVSEENIIDSLLELIKFIRRAKPGDIAIIEEVSVLFPSRRAMSSDNVAIARVLDTCRKKGVILFANAPIFDSIDKHIRCLAHISIETLKIVKSQGVVVSKALRLQTNPASGKTYLHRFNRKGREVHRVFTKMPEGDIWERYESKKDKFMDNLYSKLKAKAELVESKELKAMGKEVKVVQEKPLSQGELKVQQMVNVNGLTQTEAARQMGISVPRVNQILKNINKKCSIVPKNEAIKLKNYNSDTIN